VVSLLPTAAAMKIQINILTGNRERPVYLLLSAASGVLCMYIDSGMNVTDPGE